MAHDVKEVTETSSSVELGEKLWLAEDGSVVKDGDPAAVELIGIPGQRLSRDAAVGFGLVKPTKDEQAALDEQAKASEAAMQAAQTPAFGETDAELTSQDRVQPKQRASSANKQRKKGGGK